MKTYQPERALIARETHEEKRKDLARMLDQIAMQRPARLPPSMPLVSLETQFQINIQRTREDVQRFKDAQTADLLRWLRS